MSTAKGRDIKIPPKAIGKIRPRIGVRIFFLDCSAIVLILSFKGVCIDLTRISNIMLYNIIFEILVKSIHTPLKLKIKTMAEQSKKNIRTPIRGRIFPIALGGILISLPLAVLTGYAVASDYMLYRKKSSQVVRDKSQSDVSNSKKLPPKSFQNSEDFKKD